MFVSHLDNIMFSSCQAKGARMGRPASGLQDLAAAQRHERFVASSTASSSSSVEEDFDVLPEHSLGSGSFGTVILAKDKVTGDEVALKRISVNSSEDELLALKELELTRRVAKTGPSCRCVKAIAGYSSRGASEGSFNIVYDLMRGGSLQDLDLARNPISEENVKSAMRQVLAGIKALHRARVAHFDIKLANLLLETPGDWESVRICDLGMAQDLRKKSAFHMIAGTPQCFAPELVLAYLKGSSFGKEADLWAAGVVMYELLCGAKPFPSMKSDVLFRQIYNVELRFAEPAWNTTISPEAKQLVTQLLTFNPKKRLTAKQALSHSWFSAKAAGKNEKSVESWLPSCMRPAVRC